MLNRTDLRGSATDPRDVLPRAELDVAAAIEKIRPTVEAVAQHGVDAVLAASETFDGVRPRHLRVPDGELRACADRLDPAVRAALAESIDRARRVHADQRRTDVSTQVVPGGTVTERWVPVSRVGLYVPGGLAPLLSSVVMNVVPAQVAGVGSIALATPPQRDTGLPHPGILGACALLGVDEVYSMGGSQAVAGLAYGLRDADGGWLCEPVDLITGPGNVYVTAAKRMLRGVVGIDSEAGTTEIAILADDTADPVHVAADLISQAEHDPAAASVLVTPSERLLAAVEAELTRQVPATRHRDRVRTALTGKQSGVVLVDDVAHGLRVVDAYAAEHLEIQTAEASAVAARVRNAGAIFVGPYSPVSLGDYCAGSNHVLPTGGCARHSSGLSVQSFLRGIHVVEYTEPALRDVAEHVVALSDAENLPAHGQAVTARFGGRGD
ncbi:MAG: histidinol dehydrogenase [Actinocatenispora sp.]